MPDPPTGRISIVEVGRLLAGSLAGLLAHDDHPEHLVLDDVVLVNRADELALQHHGDAIGEIGHVVDVMADQEDADALGLELHDQVANLLGLGRPERGRRLIHDEDLGVEVHGPGDRHRLALAARQRADSSREVLEPRVQSLQDGLSR